MTNREFYKHNSLNEVIRDYGLDSTQLGNIAINEGKFDDFKLDFLKWLSCEHIDWTKNNKFDFGSWGYTIEPPKGYIVRCSFNRTIEADTPEEARDKAWGSLMRMDANCVPGWDFEDGIEVVGKAEDF